MVTSNVSFEVSSTGPDLHLTVYFDDTMIWSGSPGYEPISINHDFDDSDEVTHVLELKMSGKSQDHTKIDDLGMIIEDRCITVPDIRLDGINLGYLFSQTAKYSHDFNGTKDPVEEPFWGTMGCNGSVRFEFSSPIYLWLLENL